MVGDEYSFAVYPNIGGSVKFYPLWGGEYLLERLDENFIPWEVGVESIFDTYVDTDGYIIVSPGTVFSVIEQEHEEQVVQKLLDYGGYIAIFDTFAFGRWVESLDSEAKNILSWLPKERAVNKVTGVRFNKIHIEDPRTRIFGPRGDYDKGWVKNIQPAY
jgi:hypothetical protein